MEKAWIAHAPGSGLQDTKGWIKQINLRDKVEFGKSFEHHRVKHPLSIVPKILWMEISNCVLNAWNHRCFKRLIRGN